MAWVFIVPRAGGDLTVLGDGRAAILADVERTGLVPQSGRIVPTELILLRRMENLRHIPDVARLCRGACDAAVTVIREMGPGGLRKRVVVDLGRFDGAKALDTGAALPEGMTRCVAAMAIREAESVFAGPPGGCVPSHRQLWRLPFGL
ncbi:MAG: hypothetical protein AAGE03_07110 [Pseudomonadota bacterium]